MGKTDKKQALKLRKTHPILSIVCTVFVSLLAIVFMVFLGLVAYRYLIQSKTNTQTDKLKTMVRIYDQTDDKEGIIPTLAVISDSFYIKDKDGIIIYSAGDNTCDESQSSESSLFPEEGITFYDDKAMDLLDDDPSFEEV